MKTASLIAMGALATIVLGACSPADTALERGVELRPPLGAEVTRPAGSPTSAAFNRPTLEPSPVPSQDMSPSLSEAGPWVLYCTADGRAALMDPDGRGRHITPAACPSPQTISPAAGLALEGNSVIQFPIGEVVRSACCDAAAWSADGSQALLSTVWQDDDGSKLIVYDVAADRFREIVSSDYQLLPMGISPAGTWTVYMDTDAYPESPPTRWPPGQVFAISTSGGQMSRFYDVYGEAAVVPSDTVLGWLSETAFLRQHTDLACGSVPQNWELSRAYLFGGGAWHAFGRHSFVAFDPETDTILLQELPLETCGRAEQRGPLVRLAPVDDWQPQPVALSAEWGDEWAVSQIEWHPELRQFSVVVGENEGAGPLHMVTLDPDGAIQHEFPLDGIQIASSVELFPSPDGAWIVVGASAPHGTRLYDRNGQLIKELVSEGGELSYGVEHMLWLPDSEAFFMSVPEERGLFRASARQGWEPTLVEPEAKDGTSLTLVEAPARPFRRACGGSEFTRLRIWDRVEVSIEPPLKSRLRSGPGLAASVIGMLEPGAEVDIIGGPVCSDGYVWWELQALNTTLTGWAAEGDAQGAWLVPAGSSEP